MAVDIDALIEEVVSSSDTSTTVNIASGDSAKAKGGSGL